MEGIMDRHSQTGHISQERPLERPSSSQFVTYWRQQGAGWKACLGKRRSEEGRGGLQRFGAVAVCVLRDEDGGGGFYYANRFSTPVSVATKCVFCFLLVGPY